MARGQKACHRVAVTALPAQASTGRRRESYSLQEKEMVSDQQARAKAGEHRVSQAW